MMKLNEGLSVEGMKQMARLRRSVQSEYQKRFKLSDSDEVLKMVEYADSSGCRKVSASLIGFLEALPSDKRKALADRGITAAQAVA
jgi:hypothetical protein